MKKGHGLIHREYDELEKDQREAYHYQKVAAILADYGFICSWQIADWRGADFLAHGIGGEILKVQLKSGGFEINKKYCDCEDLWMLFPNGPDWYLIKHKELVELVGEHTVWLNSDVWENKGKYTKSSANLRRKIPPKLTEALEGFKIEASP